MGSRIMDHMPNLQQLTAATPRQLLLLEATLSSSNSSMDPHMANQPQVSY